jgi:NAD(P)-dependent dehydrogenase (short-subunit alcohol dehydrogenase family)
LAARGVRVALLGRTRDPLESVATEIRDAGGTAITIPCDVIDPTAVDSAAAEVERALGTPWFLINGAGGNQADAITTVTEFTPAELAADRPSDLRGFFNLDPARYADVVRVNIMGTVIPCQAFGRGMAKLGRGSILTFSSMTGYKPLSRVPAYSTAKTGIVRFTEWLATYLAPAGIRVNGVAPGFYVNDRSRKILYTRDGSLSDRGANVVAHTAMKRFGEPRELCGCVRWLLNDDEAGFVTGTTVPVDGGFLASPGI